MKLTATVTAQGLKFLPPPLPMQAVQGLSRWTMLADDGTASDGGGAAGESAEGRESAQRGSANWQKRRTAERQHAPIGAAPPVWQPPPIDIAVVFLPHLEAEAKERQGKRTDLQNIQERIPERVLKKLPLRPDLKGQSRDQAAATFGVNPRYVSDAKRIAKRKTPANRGFTCARLQAELRGFAPRESHRALRAVVAVTCPLDRAGLKTSKKPDGFLTG